MWSCYILRNLEFAYRQRTYNGSTNDLTRRLRQHNREISGGAKATKFGTWEYCAVLTGLENYKNALSCEWRIKHPSGKPGKRSNKFYGPIGRIKSLNLVLKLDKWTNQCVISNPDQGLKLYVVKDLVQHLNLDDIPENIDVEVISVIDPNKIELDFYE